MNELLPFGEFAPRERAPALAPHFLMGLESWELERILHRLNVTNSHSSMAGRARRSRNRSEAVAISGELSLCRYPSVSEPGRHCLLAWSDCLRQPQHHGGGPCNRCEAVALSGEDWWGQHANLGPGRCVSHQQLSKAQKEGCWQGLTGCSGCIADVANTSSGQHRAHAGSSGREQPSSSGAQASPAEGGLRGEPSSDVEQLGEGAFPSSWPPASERSKLPMVSSSALVCCMCGP